MNQQINESVSHTLMWSNRLSAVRHCGESRRLVTQSQRRRCKRDSDWRRQRDAGREALRWRDNHTGEMERRAREENTVRQTQRAKCKHIHHMLQIISLCCCHNWLIDWPTGWLTGWLAATLARWLHWLPGRWGGWLTYCLIGWLTPIISWRLTSQPSRWQIYWLIHGQYDWMTS